MARETLSYVSCMQLCAPIQVGAIPLHDDREFHCSDVSGEFALTEAREESSVVLTVFSSFSFSVPAGSFVA